MSKNFEDLVRIRNTRDGPELYIGELLVKSWLGVSNNNLADLKRILIIEELNKYVDQRETPAVAKFNL